MADFSKSFVGRVLFLWFIALTTHCSYLVRFTVIVWFNKRKKKVWRLWKRIHLHPFQAVTVLYVHSPWHKSSAFEVGAVAPRCTGTDRTYWIGSSIWNSWGRIGTAPGICPGWRNCYISCSFLRSPPLWPRPGGQQSVNRAKKYVILADQGLIRWLK